VKEKEKNVSAIALKKGINGKKKKKNWTSSVPKKKFFPNEKNRLA